MRRLKIFVVALGLTGAAFAALQPGPAMAQEPPSGPQAEPANAAAAKARSLSERLEALEGKRRALVIFAPNRGDARFGRQRLIAQRHVKDFVAHRIVVVEAAAKGGLADRLGLTAVRRRFDVAPDDFAVVLLDLTGEVLLRSDEPVSAERLMGVLPVPD